jgi:magnesium transporter
MIFTLAIPSTVIGTFYGMNVNLPGGIEDNSMILGPFTTFIVVILASAIPAIMMFIYFKKLGWISS